MPEAKVRICGSFVSFFAAFFREAFEREKDKNIIKKDRTSLNEALEKDRHH